MSDEQSTPDRTNTCRHSVGWYGKRCHWTSAATEFTRSKSMASTAASAIGSSQSDMAKCKELGGSMIAIEFQSHTDIDLFDAARARVELVQDFLFAITVVLAARELVQVARFDDADGLSGAEPTSCRPAAWPLRAGVRSGGAGAARRVCWWLASAPNTRGPKEWGISRLLRTWAAEGVDHRLIPGQLSIRSINDRGRMI
ncbi:hypothetical protein CI41S_66960 [Bradyrhizobium ivorense]|nr:hypothetical protein CI41S_66960 [Bradyrhizobium ivorense]